MDQKWRMDRYFGNRRIWDTYAVAGMFMTLIDIYHNCDLGAFIGCTIIGVLVLSTAGVGIYGIVAIIKKHKDLFKW